MINSCTFHIYTFHKSLPLSDILLSEEKIWKRFLSEESIKILRKSWKGVGSSKWNFESNPLQKVGPWQVKVTVVQYPFFKFLRRKCYTFYFKHHFLWFRFLRLNYLVTESTGHHQQHILLFWYLNLPWVSNSLPPVVSVIFLMFTGVRNSLSRKLFLDRSNLGGNNLTPTVNQMYFENSNMKIDSCKFRL